MDLLGRYLRDRESIGAIATTSVPAVRRVSRLVQQNARAVVEYGPGKGPVSKWLLKPNGVPHGKLAPDGQLILIERDRHMADELRATMTDARVRVFQACATEVKDILQECGVEQADHVLMSIPLTSIAEKTRTQILTQTRDVLTEDGSCVVFLYNPFVDRYLRPVFPQIRRDFELFNIPPMSIFEARKKAAVR